MNFAERFKLAKIAKIKGLVKTSNNKELQESPTVNKILLQSLSEDVKNLSIFPQGEKRNEQKVKLVDAYRTSVDTYVENKEVYANPILVRFIIWLIDLERWSEVVKYAARAVTENQAMPEPFTRNLITFIADSYVYFAEKCMKINVDFDVDYLQGFLACDVHDKIKAKICKITAQVFCDNGLYVDAGKQAKQAIVYDSEIGVKTLLKTIEKAEKKG